MTSVQPVVKSASTRAYSYLKRSGENARVFDLELTDAAMQTLDALDRTSPAANARG
jgi:diketogulonate reductase-like aldo/keto reductase